MATALVVALRARGVDVQTVVEAGLRGKDDKAQLERAAANKRTLDTFNVSDFCRLHREYLERESSTQVSSLSHAKATPLSNKTTAYRLTENKVRRRDAEHFVFPVTSVRTPRG
jgi:hypothetical protein